VGGTLLGIAFRPGTRDIYASTTGRVMVAHGNDDGSFGAPAVVVGNLPTGRHQNDQIAFTQDGRLFFIGMGSTCDACVEKDPRNASIMRIAADGSQQVVYAHGLRNPFGLAIHPATGELFATDNGRDVPVAGVPDELNVVIQNGNYGWPDCWGRGQGSNCQGTIPPVAELQDHSSANGFAFYTGTNFPQDYRGNVFVALWGGNVPIPSVGKRVDRVILSRTNGQWQGTVSSFASGFDHPIAVAVGPNDGALYVADHGSGQIYRILWEGQ
jgi:glucose/arabinose dehydrogenase